MPGLLSKLLTAVAAVQAAAKTPQRPDAAIVKQPSIELPTNWSVSRVKCALDKHEQGDFSESADLADAMGRDERISSCLQTRVSAVSSKNGLDFAIVPPDGGPQKLADLVTTWWHDAITDAALKALASDMIMLGVAIARQHWELREREWKIVRVERWHLSSVHWDQDKERFVTQTADGQLLTIEPGDPNWLVITPAGERSWMAGAVRALGIPFVMRQWNWRDWANYNERHGIPIIMVEEPPTNDKKVKDDFYQQLKNMGSRGILRLPQTPAQGGFKASYLEPKDKSFESFDSFKGALDVGIAVYLLGQNLTTEVQGGSRAAATVHDNVRNDRLCADTEGLSTPLRAQTVTPWCMFNVAGFKPEDAPWPTWDTSLPDDLKGDADTLNVLGDAVTKLETAGFPVDGDELAARFNLPLRKGEKYTAPEPPEEPEREEVNQEKAPGASKSKGTATSGAASTRPRAGTKGLVSGQAYIDDVAENRRADAGAALEGTLLAELLEVIESARGYDEIKAALTARYKNTASPVRMREMLEQALVLADLAGTLSVRQDNA